MRLVDHEQARPDRGQPFEHVRFCQLLGRQEDELDVARRNGFPALVHDAVALRRVGRERTMPEQAQHLVALKGDER